jgi:membrane-associated phospholipid phosphatase
LAELAARPPGLSPMEESRMYAMAFIAAHDALNAIDPRYRTYLPAVSARAAHPDAAVAAAMHGVLRHHMPQQATALDAALASSLGRVADGNAKTEGVNLGVDRAQAILADRANDGSADAQGPYTPGAAPGSYQPTPPIDVATFVNWGKVRPFALASGSQFRAEPPHGLASLGYATDFLEVKLLGGAQSTFRTADQSEIARFWLESTPLSWQRILTLLTEGANGWVQAMRYATLQIAMADAYIAALDSKYFYNFWRPITAIRAAATDGNPDTVADGSWEPLDPVTPPVPDHVSAHATAAMAGAVVMLSWLDPDNASFSYGSTSLPGVTRQYYNPYYAAIDIGLSRIYVGYHFRRAVEQGWDMGWRVGEAATSRLLG